MRGTFPKTKWFYGGKKRGDATIYFPMCPPCACCVRPGVTRRSFSARGNYFWTTATSAAATLRYWSIQSQALRPLSVTPCSGTTTVSLNRSQYKIKRLAFRLFCFCCCYISGRLFLFLVKKRRVWTVKCSVSVLKCRVILSSKYGCYCSAIH